MLIFTIFTCFLKNKKLLIKNLCNKELFDKYNNHKFEITNRIVNGQFEFGS